MGEDKLAEVKSNRLGRNLKLTEELLEEACKVLRLGNYVKTTCEYLGIWESTWYDWINRGKVALEKEKEGLELDSKEKLLSDFYKQTKRAESEAIVRNLQIIQKAAERNWQAAAWSLERRYPEMFALNQRIMVGKVPDALTEDDIQKAIEERKRLDDSIIDLPISDENEK